MCISTYLMINILTPFFLPEHGTNRTDGALNLDTALNLGGMEDLAPVEFQALGVYWLR